MFEEYIKYATETNVRLPKKLRTDKKMAQEFLTNLINNGIQIQNSAIYTLAQWAKIDLFPIKEHAKIKNIKFLNVKEMVGDLTVPDGSSYTANGIIVHNCNLPESATKDVVAQVYMRAWETGCKGFTIYREGCRTGVLLSKDELDSQKGVDEFGRPTDVIIKEAPKRPIELPCEIRKVKINGEAWTTFVGLLKGKPYEVFGGLSKYVDIPNKYKTGKIIKNGKVSGVTTYNLCVGEGDDQMVIKDIVDIFENQTYGAFTRILSLNLRHGTPVQYVTEQLQKDKHSDVISFSKVIARVLKNYIEDGVKASSEKKCPDCSAENSLYYYEHCLSCSNCPWKKCS